MTRKQNLVASILIALALHAALGVSLALFLSHARDPEEFAQLDLNSVDLSFAETVEESATAADSAPSAPAAMSPPPPPAAVPPPESSASEVTLPLQQNPVLPDFPAAIESFAVPTAVASETPELKTRDEEKARATRGESPPKSQVSSPKVTASVAPRQAHVDAPPRPRRNIKPDYPRESRLRGEQGKVVLEFDVVTDGSVSGVRVIRSPGYPLLDDAAVKAARAARFTPANSGGNPVASTVRMSLDFKLK